MINRRRLFDAARGILYKPGGTTVQNESSVASRHHRPLRCFPLQLEHIQEAFEAPTPTQFHSLLCDKIRQAQTRVLLASLYVGPAASPVASPKEQELLDALRVAADKPQVQVNILLDKNRALRPVPLSGDVNAAVTSSAQAVYKALHAQEEEKEPSNNGNNNLFLFSVLPPSLQYFLPNPYNEVAGVFHIKVYIIDDSLILSGANLSEEYFVDRHDRYLHFTKGAGGLVDFYHEFVQLLCDHSEVYTEETNTATNALKNRTPTTRQQLLTSLNKLLTTTADEEENDNNKHLLAEQDGEDNNDGKTVAVAIPTFQAPESFFSGASRSFPDDTEVTRALLQNALEQQQQQQQLDSKETIMVRLSSAYLNPTENMLRLLAEFSHIEFLTAGKTSHGFAPKKKAGNKGKDWIPSVFDSLSREACQHLEAAKLLHYERPGWTFHAKGLWLSSSEGNNNHDTVAAICGSGNYGARSETLDMESNCVLILPPNSSLQQPLQQEWINMLEYTQQPPLQSKVASSSSANETEVIDDGSSDEASLSWPLQVCLPIIRKFL